MTITLSDDITVVKADHPHLQVVVFVGDAACVAGCGFCADDLAVALRDQLSLPGIEVAA